MNYFQDRIQSQIQSIVDGGLKSTSYSSCPICQLEYSGKNYCGNCGMTSLRLDKISRLGLVNQFFKKQEQKKAQYFQNQVQQEPVYSAPQDSSVLSKNRHAVMEVNQLFSVSVMTPWIKGKMDVDDHNVMVDLPNTIFLGLIPAGRRKYTTPLGNVSNVYTSNYYLLFRYFIGIPIMILGLAALFNALNDPLLYGGGFGLFLLFAIIGFLIAASGKVTIFCYENNGREVFIHLPFFEANHAEEFAERVIEKINKYNDDRNGLINSQINAQLINQQIQMSAQAQMLQNEALRESLRNR